MPSQYHLWGLRKPGNRGVALIFVLMGLVLISVLIVAFLLTAQSELQSSRQYAAGAAARQLADATLQVASAQVVDATQAQTSAGGRIAWASQPGMIRTYDERGDVYRFYKLYSSDVMVLDKSQAAAFKAEDDVPSGWADEPALYTDINAPVLVPSATGLIIPNADEPSGTFEARYPVLDPMAAASGIEGFSLDKDNDGTADTPPSASYNPLSDASANPAPMPVRWIYVLEDGTLTVPDSAEDGGKVAAWSGTKKPTRENPIVGRIAFWIDDESAKININTAAEGTYWDTPRVNTPQDRQNGSGSMLGFAMSQPFRNEWQRYPGHPATTALSPVFFPGVTLTNDQKEQLYNEIVPRVAGGGSKGGEVKITFLGLGSVANPSIISPDADRLYANIDELLMKPSRSENPLITPATLERARFFLTASSRAPELNLFNLPRIGIWPVHSSISGTDEAAISSYTTVFDRTIAACSTYGSAAKKPFFFQRQNSRSLTEDYAGSGMQRNRQLYSYLQRLTSENVPGFGGNLLAKYPMDRDQILTQIFDYIRCTNEYDDSLASYTTTTPPVTYQFTGALAASATTGDNTPAPSHAQVMPVEIDAGGTDTHGFGRCYSLSEIGLAFLCASDPKEERASLPTLPNPTASGYTLASTETASRNFLGPYGDLTGDGKIDAKDVTAFVFGKAPTPAAGVNDLNGDAMVDEKDYHIYQTTTSGTSSADYRVIQATILLEAFSPQLGYHVMKPDFSTRITGLNMLRMVDATGLERPLFLTDPSLLPDDPAHQVVIAAWRNTGRNELAWEAYDQRPLGGVSGIRWPYGSFSAGEKDANKGGGATAGTRLVVPAAGAAPTMQFKSVGNITIQLCRGGYIRRNSGGEFSSTGYLTQVIKETPNPALVYQTITARFPNESFPVPEIVKTGTPDISKPPFNVATTIEGNKGATPKRLWWTWHNPNGVSRIYGTKSNGGDVIGSNPGFAKTDYAYQGRNGPVQGAGCVLRVDTFEPRAGDPDGAPDLTKRLPVPKERDVVRTLVPLGNDSRLIAGRRTVSPDLFVPHPEYSNPSVFFAHSFMELEDAHYGPRTRSTASGLPVAGYTSMGLADTAYNVHRLTDTPLPVSSLPAHALDRGDYDNGIGTMRDGAYTNKPDDGNTVGVITNQPGGPYASSSHPYYVSVGNIQTVGQTYFSPNRKVPSPVMFGSLPSGLKSNIPFQTLLFRPGTTFDPTYMHPGAGVPVSGPPYTTPPDHLLLDLFTMPVVEPYPISEPFSTAGKINMNYQIMPFSHIKRATGIHAVLKNELLPAIPNSSASTYKWRNPVGTTDRVDNTATHDAPLRHGINVNETLKGFEARFEKGDIFRSASEICNIHLVPTISGVTYESMANGSFWPNYRLTGDNSRERPYANIYPRLTTKSNTYTVHVRTQSLKKALGTPDEKWIEGRDKVTGEYRGSNILERYIDVSDDRLPDFATDTTANVDMYYRTRVVSSKKFAP
ncbi:hypothetical protein DB346_00755 [Verrucomicrobia bacterium LW23]|nr:hypothetical protein DB346_00755 [Verrucomicrobia bacterium LW23]